MSITKRSTALALVLMSAGLAATIHSAPLRTRELRYQAGRTYQYDYAVTIKTTSAARDAGGVRQDGGETTVIEALVNLAITGAGADGYAGELSLQDAAVSRTDGTAVHAVNDAETLRALETPLRFTQAKNGAITAVSIPANAPLQAVNIQKGVLNALQLTLRQGDSYVALENAGQGVLRAQYTLRDAGQQLHVAKRYDERSFDRLVSSGAANPRLKLQNDIEMTLDNASGVVSSVSYEERIATGDGAPAGAGFDGVTAWSTVKATGSLKLRGVVKSSKGAKAVAYTTDALEARLTDGRATRAAIGLDSVDIRGELAALEREPRDPRHHARLLALIEADAVSNDRHDVLGAIADRMAATAANEDVAAAYVDLLGSAGTPRAQNVLNAVLGNTPAFPALASAGFGPRVREQALFSIVRVETPTLATVHTLEALIGRGSPERDTAITVLGAVAGRLQKQNEADAERIARQLEAELATAATPADIQLYLNAIGNAGLPSSLRVITPYVEAGAQAPEAIQAAALSALRKIPGDEVDTLLRRAVSDASAGTATRTLAAAVMGDRERLIGESSSLIIREPIDDPWEEPIDPGPTPTPTPPPPGQYSKSWTLLLGNTDLGVEFPGGINVAMPPAASSVNANAYQHANARLFGMSFQVVAGELRAFRDGNDLVFGAYLSIANNLIRRQFEQRFPCALARQGNLYSGTAQFLDVTTRIPVYAVITLDLNVRASGTFTLDWNFSADACSIVVGTLQVGIVPRAWVTAQASAYLDIIVARGGATLTATLLDTSIPARASLTWNVTAPPALKFCMDITATTRPLSGALDIWADVALPTLLPPFFEWSRVGSMRLWQFSTPAWTYPILQQCF